MAAQAQYRPKVEEALKRVTAQRALAQAARPVGKRAQRRKSLSPATPTTQRPSALPTAPPLPAAAEPQPESATARVARLAEELERAREEAAREEAARAKPATTNTTASLLLQRELLSYADLRALGINYSRAHLYRKMAAGTFPRTVKLGPEPYARAAWVAAHVARYLAKLQSGGEDKVA